MEKNLVGVFQKMKRRIVHECPKTEDAVNLSRIKMGCGSDKYGNNQYMCLPREDLEYLEEFCYPREMGIQEEGYCLVVTDNRELQHVSCKSFSNGCPDEFYHNGQFYKYPACLEINRLERCYINQPLCPPIIPVLFTTPRGLFTGENTTNVHSISPSETRIHFSSMLPTTPIIDKYVFPPESSAAVDKLYIGSSDKSLKEWILPSAASSFLSPEKKASFPEKIEPPVQNSSLIQEYSSDKLTLNHLMTKLLSTQTSVSAHMQTASSTMPIQYWNDNKKDNETNITSDLNYSVSTNFLDVIYVILAVFGVILLYLCIRQTVKDLLHVTKRKNQRKETSEEEFEYDLGIKLVKPENVEQDEQQVILISMEDTETDV